MNRNFNVKIKTEEEFFFADLIAENDILGTNYRHLLHGLYRTIFRASAATPS